MPRRLLGFIDELPTAAVTAEAAELFPRRPESPLVFLFAFLACTPVAPPTGSPIAFRFRSRAGRAAGSARSTASSSSLLLLAVLSLRSRLPVLFLLLFLAAPTVSFSVSKVCVVVPETRSFGWTVHTSHQRCINHILGYRPEASSPTRLRTVHYVVGPNSTRIIQERSWEKHS